MSDLKPCPFCGGSALVSYKPASQVYFVLCTGCAASAGNEPNKQPAIDEWNKRALLVAQPPAAAAPVAQGLTRAQREYMRGYKEECQAILQECIEYWKDKYETLLAKSSATEPLQGTQEPSARVQQAEPVAWVDEKSEALIFGGWDKQPFSRRYKPVFYDAPAPGASPRYTQADMERQQGGE